MRQALIALTLSAGLLAFPVTALADSDKSNKHKRFSDHHHQKHVRAIHDYRSERRQQKIHHKRHRIEKYRHFNGDNYRHWKSRRQPIDGYHLDRRHFNKNRRHYKAHHRHGLKHRRSGHNNHDREYLEWVAIMLILNEALDNKALDDDYR